MRLIDLGGFSRARVWQGELPDLVYPESHAVKRVVRADAGVVAQSTCGAVEVILPHGASFHDGLLGARFTPDVSGELRILIRVVDPGIKHVVDWSLAARVDIVHPGLPPYCVAAVVAGVTMSQDLGTLGSGELCFDCAAFGEVGSAERVFEQLARAVVRLCSFPKETISAQQLRAFFSVS